MTKELSKQICEKCGVPPLYKYKIWLPVGVTDVFNKYQLKQIDFKSYKYKKPKVIEVIKVYPDFGQYENFVKLIELEFGNWTLIELITTTYAIANRQNFLEAVDEYLTVGKYGLRIRKAIREAEWKYE